MRSLLVPTLVLALTAAACGGGSTEEAGDGSEGALVGGVEEAGFRSVGYLATADRGSEPLCGATLVASNVVVTAAHCVYRNKDKKLTFGVGDLGGERVGVRSVHYHPSAHVESSGFIDLVHALRLNDLAYVVLDKAVAGVTPAQLSKESPTWAGCDVSIVGYGKNDDTFGRRSAGGCVILKPEILDDQIIEIKPTKGSAVCHADGDEGHAAMAKGPDGKDVLIAVYVGSVSQSVTDCKKYTQLLNGYEDVAGHADFFAEAARAGGS